MVFPTPLGLGLKTPKFPWITVCLILSYIGFFIFYKSFNNRALIYNTYKKNNYFALRKKLVAEHCYKKSLSTNDCQYYYDVLIKEEKALAGKKFNKKKQKKIKTPEKKKTIKKTKIDLSEVKGVFNKMQVLIKFFGEFDEKILNLKSAKEYKAAKAKIEFEITTVHKNKNVLSKNNLNFSSALLAQFLHGGFLHLFGNSLFMLFFGIYLECRMKAINFLGLYFASGFMGLIIEIYFFMPMNVPLVGASANISGVVGGFFIFFYRHYFKLLIVIGLTPIPYLFSIPKTVLIPMRIAIPLLYIANDLSGAASRSGNVAHFAHLGGLVMGMLIAYLIKNRNEISWPFIYLEEWRIFNEAKMEKGYERKINMASELIKYNPMNYVVQSFLLDEIINKMKLERKMSNFDFNILKQNVEPFVGRSTFKKDFNNGVNLLSNIPLNLKFADLMPSLGGKATLKLADHALDHGKLALALKLYIYFLGKKKKTNLKTKKAILMTVGSILENFETSQGQIARLQVIQSISGNQEISLMINNRINTMTKEAA